MTTTRLNDLASLALTSHNANKPDLSQFETPAVRHLAWLCQSAQLIRDPCVFAPEDFLPKDYLATLQTWDKHPTLAPDILNTPPHYRLGHYVEALYACLLTDLLGWTLLARNLPVRDDGITLGELDFVVQNPLTRDVEHHEIAIKFYLGYHGSASHPPGWYGPNPRDRLDIKTTRMLQQQRQRALLPASLRALSARGIAAAHISRVFMPGYLFYPLSQMDNNTAPAQIPSVSTLSSVPASHLRGHWMYLDRIAETDTTNWVPLIKPHWLGPWLQKNTPDPFQRQQTLSAIRQTQSPRLFARLEYNSGRQLWSEKQRIFVVPSQWPGAQ
jgi:hypothetical protein